MNSFLNRSAVVSYKETIEKETMLFALRLATMAGKKNASNESVSLRELTREIRRMTTAVSVKISYGVDREFFFPPPFVTSTSSKVHAFQKEEYESKVALAEEGFLSVNTIPALGLHPLDLWPRRELFFGGLLIKF